MLIELSKTCQSALQGSWHLVSTRMPQAIIIVVCGLPWRAGQHWVSAMVSKWGLMQTAIEQNVVNRSKCAAQLLVFQSEPGTFITILTPLGS